MIADALSILMDPQRWGGDSGFIMRSEQHIVLTLVVLIIGSVLAIPLGISYEYGHVVMDARYNFPLTKAEKEIGSKNKCFTFSVGYKFEILR